MRAVATARALAAVAAAALKPAAFARHDLGGMARSHECGRCVAVCCGVVRFVGRLTLNNKFAVTNPEPQTPNRQCDVVAR